MYTKIPDPDAMRRERLYEQLTELGYKQSRFVRTEGAQRYVTFSKNGREIRVSVDLRQRFTEEDAAAILANA